MPTIVGEGKQNRSIFNFAEETIFNFSEEICRIYVSIDFSI